MFCIALFVLRPDSGAAQAPAPATPFDGQVAAAKAAMMADPEAALRHARNASTLAGRLADPQDRLIAEATGQWLESEALLRVNRPEEAAALVNRGLATATRHAPRTKLHADLLKARAGILLVTGSVQRALADLLSAHEVYRALGDGRSQAIVLQHLGSIYLDARDYDRALRYYQQANEAYSEDPALAVAAHNNRGNALKDLGRYGDAEREYRLALAAARTMGSDLLEARILSNLASAQMLDGDLASAEQSASLGLRISARSAVGWEPYLWGVRAQVELARGDLVSARRYIERTFAGVDLDHSTMPFRDFHDAASRIYVRSGDPAAAFRHLAAFKRLDDEARNVAATTGSALMAARFDAANQEARIARLRAEQILRDADLAASRARLERLTLVGAIGLVTVLIIFTVGFFSFRAVRRSRNRVAEANVKLNHAARHDALTGLPNRRFIRELLQDGLNDVVRPADGCALLLIDLDRFKAVNDTLGHEAGDALLLEVGNRLHEVLPEGARAGRLGGDEFAAIVWESDRKTLDTLAIELICALSAPYDICGSTALIGASIGIASGSAEARSVDVVTRNADLALYSSKHKGRGKHTFFEPAMLEDAEERRRMEADLRTAMVGNQLSIAYQPIVDSQRGEVVAFEALLRWNHPVRGEIAPSQFIPIAEEAGLIRGIGEWVLRSACAEAARWPEHVKLAVNLSAIQVEAEGLVASVVRALAHSGLAPSRLEFEVTESVYMRQGESTGKTLDALKSLGVGLALDDFGTGYSSLGYLQRTDFSKIKIDRSFVKAAADGCQDSLAIVQAIVSMAHGLGMATTAEGIETEAERDLVRRLGCTQIQGFLIGRPERREPPGAKAPEATPPLIEQADIPPVSRRATRRG
ncbi:EAL domain-containing protein [Sphingosinicella terrae]|uniref:EAL domain-containing protein n=1 Tax=Sphingosinicella terrae TaxID=2172047 RepID=UPI0013B36A68|nr:EAL domain-containing protein [Sphingosinicella terrae]